MKIPKYYLIAAMLGTLATPLMTKGQTIGVQLYDTTNPNTYPLHSLGGPPTANIKAGYAPVAQTNWNSLTGAAAYTPPWVLNGPIDNTGATTPIELTASGFIYGTAPSSPYGFTSTDPNETGDNDLAANELLETVQQGQPATITITNIPYSQYAIYVYTASDTSGNYAKVTIGSSSQYFISTNLAANDNSSGWVIIANTTSSPGSPGDLLVFSNLTGNAQQIVISANGSPGYDNVGINGIQIVSTAGPTAGKSVGVQFYESTSRGEATELYSTPSPAVNLEAGFDPVAQINWNSIDADGGSASATGLIDSTGATNATVTMTASGLMYGTYGGFDGTDPNEAGDNVLASGELLSAWGNVATATFNNIPYSQYTIYVYLASDGGDQNNPGSVTIGSSTQNYIATQVSASGDTAGWLIPTNTLSGSVGDVLVFANLTGTSQTINWFVPNNGGVNGFQIVPTSVSSPPAAVANLIANGGIQQVSLNWNASSGATSYNVFRGTSSGKESGPIATVNSTSYTDTTSVAGTTYYYIVDAVNSYGYSFSSEASATPSWGPYVPATPTGLTASGQFGQILMAWNAAGGAASYNLYRGTSPGGESGTPIATGITSTSYVDTNIVIGTTYYYTVVAVDGTGDSGVSNEANAASTSNGAGTSIGVQFLMIQNQAQALNTTPVEYFYGPDNGDTNANWKAGYGPIAQTNWNTIGGVYGYISTVKATNLIGSSNNLTTAAVSATGYFYSGGGGFDGTDPNETGDNLLANNSVLALYGNPATVNLSGIPYTNYTIYFYLANGYQNGPAYLSNNITGAVQSFTATPVYQSGDTAGWTNAPSGDVGDLLVVSGLTGASQDFTLLDPNGNTGFNGLQIVSSTGASIGIQFWLNGGVGNDLHTPTPVNLKAGVPSVAQTNWNSIITDYQGAAFTSTYSNLVDSVGATINSLFAAVSGTAWSQASYFDSSDPNQIGDSYLGSGTVLAEGATHAYVGITNIPYPQYDIYVYLAVDNQGNSGQCTIGSVSDLYTTVSVDGGYVSTSQWQTITNQGDFADYLVFTNLTGSSQLIDLYVPSNGGINGFQIVPTGVVAPSQIRLNVSYAAGNVTLTWADPSFSLQSATNVNGPYTTIVGATSGYTQSVSGTQKFYRLIH
jgi:fibronectin type 3 domain-containing protein